MKVGIFSGTFDPIHRGHIALGKNAIEEAELDKLVFLPESKPRRKNTRTSPKQRVDMLKIAISNLENSEVFRSQSDSHSVGKTMAEIHEKYGVDNDYYLIMGADVFEHIESWADHSRLVEQNSFIVGLRSEDDGEIAVEVAQRLNIKPTMIVSSFPTLSSSKIRQSLRSGVRSNDLADSVFEYIQEKQLYER